MSQFDDPNREAVGVAPAGTGAGVDPKDEPEPVEEETPRKGRGSRTVAPPPDAPAADAGDETPPLFPEGGAPEA